MWKSKIREKNGGFRVISKFCFVITKSKVVLDHFVALFISKFYYFLHKILQSNMKIFAGNHNIRHSMQN
jgi:hypothetical protein